MAKKIALLLSLVMMFTISCVFATEADETATSDTVVSGEVLEVVTEGSGEEVVENEEVSGETEETTTPAEDEEVSGEVEETTTPAEDEEVSDDETSAEEKEDGNGTVLAAVIAIVIVIAVVAIVSVLKKK